MASSESRYVPADLEPRRQRRWAELGLDRTPDPSDERSENFYALSMFPYPSGNLHMGHVRNYVITDVIARVQRLRGRRVLHPMGWDAFGLPAENAAIERGVDPAAWTERNIAQMRAQLQRLGLSIDWEREVTTCRPDYYRWTQWLFLQFLDAGLAYRREATVNWDPVDQTVLANEQVDAEGRSWRSGAKVEKRKLRQWFLRITALADALLDDLPLLEGWPERVRTMQANWIGRSRGALLRFPLLDAEDGVEVFTTRPDTVYGVSYVVLAPEHPLVERLTSPDRQDAVEAFRAEVAATSEQERVAEDRPKRGVALGGAVRHPFSGDAVPVWIADYVLPDYGTGAVMGVPAHDSRDFAFASSHGLAVRTVVVPADGEIPGEIPNDPPGEAFTAPGRLVNSGRFDGLVGEAAISAVVEAAAAAGCGEARTTYRLRDWLISRQRYWGCPIPVIHCDHCGVVPVPVEQLPVELPSDVDLSGSGGSPLERASDWRRVPCPCCGAEAHRETDTMDTFMCSSWYYLRYTDAGNGNEAFAREAVDRWLPVDQYVGGVEHAILHLLYSRFFTKVLAQRQLVGCREPFRRLLTQGMVQGITYRSPSSRRYVPSAAVADPSAPTDPDTGEALEVFYEKMSKSKHNGVDPGAVIDRYGADTARMFILFKAPPEKDLEWDDADVEGQYRFLQRIWRLCDSAAQGGLRLGSPAPWPRTLADAERDLRRAVHGAIEAIEDDLLGDELQCNTAVAELMKLSNAMGSGLAAVGPAVAQEAVTTLLLLLAPFAPHLADELWEQLGGEGSIHRQRWPQLDPTALVRDTVTVVLQVKGKVRGQLEVPADLGAADLEQLALASEVAQRWLEGAAPRRVIVVPGKLVNLVP
ncbi:MAG: leucine--tRNA ligase [Synechococcus sp. Tobar2m-G35]|nr:leucine--tRNA ligase [Synechococcus sp. Tobar2m-G35]